MITALAVETLLVSVLAWMSIQASVTLAAILTVILLPWALLSMRQSAGFAWMTLAMLAMLWRGEAWKTVFLQSEQQVLELQQQQQPRVSPKIEYPIPVSFLACGDAHHVPPQVLRPFLAGEFVEAHRSVASGAQSPQEDCEPYKGNHNALVNLQRLDLEGCLALLNAEPGLEPHELHLGSQTDFSRFGLELP
jgi:hypothetical protein